MTRLRAVLLAASLLGSLAAFSPAPVVAQGIPQNIPRKELLILENPEGTIKNAGWFNIWAINAGSQSNGLQQAALDTLWYIDPEKGLDGAWDNSLAADKPVYNADFTEMQVKLRRGLFWSDGVEFTSADVKATVAVPSGSTKLDVFLNGRCVVQGVAVSSGQAQVAIPAAEFKRDEKNFLAFISRDSNGAVKAKNVALLTCLPPPGTWFLVK